MAEWLTAHYSLLIDFAGPIATVIAAVVAAFITLVFGLAQFRLARSQRDIARDNLKFALLKERYAIYEATKKLIETVSLIHDVIASDTIKIRDLYIKLDEARFYFPKEICDYLKQITVTAELYFSHLSERDQINIDDATRWAEQADILSQDFHKLRSFYARLPGVFEGPLAFKQLTTKH